ncbi:MAG TPA: hypothetical protein ENN03_00325 [bacterium]|nr:hypothetical protein [bacterium]
MRTRKWVLVLALSLFIVIFGGYFGWHLTRINENLKTILLEKMEPFLAEESDIHKLEAGLGNIRLREVWLVDKEGRFSVEIEEVRVGYGFLKILRYGLAPGRITHEIVLVHPRIVINSGSAEMLIMDRNEMGLETGRVLENMKSVRLFTVLRGEAAILGPDGRRFQLAHELNGWIDAGRADSAEVFLSGNLFESGHRNLSLAGGLDLTDGRILDVNVKMSRTDPTEIPLFLKNIELNSGRMEGHGTYSRSGGLSGHLELKDAGIEFPGMPFGMDRFDVTGRLQGDTLYLEGRAGAFLGAGLQMTGILNGFWEPELDLRFASSGVPVESVFERIFPLFQPKPSGKASWTARARGPVSRLEISGTVRGEQLEWPGPVPKALTARFHYRDRILLAEAEADPDSPFSLDLKGEWDFSGLLARAFVQANTEGEYASLLPGSFSRISSCMGEAELELNQNGEDLTARLSGNMKIPALRDDTLRVHGLFDFQEGSLTADIWSNRELAVNGVVHRPFEKRLDWDVLITGIQDAMDPLLIDMPSTVFLPRINATWTGTQEQWRFDVKGVFPDQDSVLAIRISSGSSGPRGREWSLKGTAAGWNREAYRIEGQGTWDKDFIDVHRLNWGRFLKVTGTLPLNGKGGWRGRIELNDFELEQFYDYIPFLRSYAGVISGQVGLSGPADEPEIDFQTILKDGLFTNTGAFYGGLDGRIERGKFRYLSVSLNHNQTPLLVGGAQRMEGDSLIGQFWIRDADFGELVNSFTGGSRIGGRGNLEFRIRGHIDKPVIRASLDMERGSWNRFTFNELHAEIVDTLNLTGGRLTGRVQLAKFRLDRDDGLKLLAWGTMSHGQDTELDLSILGEGNIFGFVSDISPAVKESQGTGTLFMRWGGKVPEPVLGSARVNLDNGSLRMDGVVRRISRLKAQIELKQNQRFIEIGELSGRIDGERFEIRNTRSVNGGIDPLVIPPLQADLGILELKTTGKGVQIHLPGFMEKGERGWIAFKGREPGESFTIAGPPENPLVRGTLELMDTRLTFPFLSLEDDESEGLIEFLERINWDLKIVPVKDVHYVRNIVMPLGNIYTDLQLRDRYGAFYVKGVVEEGGLQTWGNLISTEGTIDALDYYFRPETITFDFPQGTRSPIVSGRAHTTVIDSMGMPSTVYLNITSYDDDTGLERTGGEWNKIKFRFSTDNPNLARSESDLLAALGYSTEAMRDRAYDIVGTTVENIVFRPLFRPLEKGIRRALGMDVVRLSSMFSRNLMEIQTLQGITFEPKYFLRSTRLILGKYLASGMFLTYTGQIQNGLGFRYPTHDIGFRHALNLEFSLRSDLFLEMEYTYDTFLLADRREDKRVWLRHIFLF